MCAARKYAEIPPVHSPSLPGFSIDANVCRNPACDNFGISAQDIEHAKYGYKFKTVSGVLKHECKRCGQNRIVYSNTSVLEAFHRCLQNSIPYASCPNEDCKNHTVNLFEYYYGDPRDKREKLYRINVEDDTKQYYQARCRSCDKTFPLAKPLRLHTGKRKQWKKDMETFVKAVTNESGPAKVANLMEISEERYYSHLKAASNALLSYNNFHISKFMREDHAPKQLQIYTDCIVCSIKTNRKDQRHQLMKIIVSACVQNKRSLVLAFHPLFDQREPSHDTLEQDSKLPLHQRRYDYLKHPYNQNEVDPHTLLNVGGYFTDEFYTYLGHFLVLRKLLARVPELHLYMDGEAALYHTALNAFADRIKAGNCDIVVRKSEKAEKGKQSRTPAALGQRYRQRKNEIIRAYKKAYPGQIIPNDDVLRRFSLTEEMERVNQAIKTGSTSKNKALFQEPLAKIFKKATQFANSSGSDYWVNNKIPINKNHTPFRLLWLTRTMKRSNTAQELQLYLNTVVFYIDNVFSTLRRSSALTARPRSTATGHKSYVLNPEVPPSLINDFTINVVFCNFFLKHRSKRDSSVAYAHGLVSKPKPPKIMKTFEFKLTFAQAKRMRQWLGT